MSNKAWGAVGLTGGGTGSLDRTELDGDLLTDKDLALVNTTNILYPYWLDSDSGASESPPTVISPDANAGTKRWILQSAHLDSLTLENKLPVTQGGTGATNATDARSNLGIVDSGDDVTLDTTSYNYLSLSGQTITLGQVDISDDTNLVAGTGVTLTGDSLSVDYGSSSSTACIGDDSRLSDSRTCDNTFDNATTSKTNLSLNNVENVAVSTWAGTTNITNVGTVSTGVWNGDSIGLGYTDAKVTSVAGSTGVVLNSDIDHDQLTNFASNEHFTQASITATGTIATGVWNGTAISDAYVANNITLDNITQITTRSHTSLTDIGSNAHSVIDTHLGASNPHSGSQASGAILDDFNTLGAAASDGQFIVATGIGAFAYESGATARTSIGLGSVEDTALSTWAGTSSITTLGTVSSGTWNGTSIAIANGGTGNTTSQASINALTSVAGATNEYLLTKDTGTGNAVWKISSGGGASSIDGLTDGTTGGGANNVGLGSTALDSLLGGGALNTALGDNAGTAVTTGTSHVMVGYRAGTAMVTGIDGTFVGADAGFAATGSYNTLIGRNAGKDQTTPTHNTCVGWSAGAENVTGGNNTIVGAQAGTGVAANSYSDNVFLGYHAGFSITTGSSNVLLGSLAGDWIATGTTNVVIGYNAASVLRATHANVLIGPNVALRGSALTNCVIMGSFAGQYLVTAIGSVLIGHTAGDKNTVTGTAVGYKASFSGTSGANNTSLGYQALFFNVTGSRNTAIGDKAGYGVSTGTHSDSTFVGYNAGGVINSGNSNTAIGSGAGDLLTTGGSNVFIGLDAGNTETTGSNNICIGTSSDIDAVAADHQYIIGEGLTGTADDAIHIGDGTDHVRCDWGTDAVWDKVSDKRKKNIIGESVLGLDFINNLRSMEFTFKAPSEFPKEWNSYNKEITESRNKNVHHGLIAQDVRSALDKIGVDEFSGWSQDPDGCQRVGDAAFIAPLIKAIQELTEKNNILSKRIDELEKVNN